MPYFTTESLNELRQRIDLVEVLSGQIDLKPAGASYKACCPFHEERTPSFVVKRGDSHYHCFGCGAHGDAISFMMDYHKMGFTEAVEALAERFGVHLEREEGKATSVDRSKLKEVLEAATELGHYYLLHTDEGREAFHYLEKRGIDRDFIDRFQIGYAPKWRGALRKALWKLGYSDELQQEVGLLAEREGQLKDFFSERILFPIRDASGKVIGFSARKYREETFGGKYINTVETPLFRKSSVLYGLNYCRRRIAKERRAIVVEGQIDALRLIREGLNLAVAALGTAFGKGHVAELVKLGVRTVYLAMDGDKAGVEAATKVGDLFQSEGVDVKVVRFPPGQDPDGVIQQQGIEGILVALDEAVDYLTFLWQLHEQSAGNSPAAKSQWVSQVTQQIRAWTDPVMVHESLRHLARIAKVPEEAIGVQGRPLLHIAKSAHSGNVGIDPDEVLEGDCLRWLLDGGPNRPHCVALASRHLNPEAFRVPACRELFTKLTENASQGNPQAIGAPYEGGFLGLLTSLSLPESRGFLEKILKRKINRDRVEIHLPQAIQRILDRNWLTEREAIQQEMVRPDLTDDLALELVKRFDQLPRPQEVVWDC